ncbi:MAG: glycosyltransferase family 4 protein [Candidatus Sulfotelmatobacter sp.]
MKILWVKANKILPVHSGGDLRSFNILRQLAVRDEVIFFSYYDEGADPDYEKNLQEQLPGAVCVNTGRRQASRLARGMDYLLRLPQAAPYAVSRFGSGKVQQRLKRCLTEQRPDVVVCDFLDAAVNFPEQVTIPAVLFQHNVESEIWRRHATNGSGPARKLIYGLEFSKMLRYEQKMVQRFDHVIAVSEHDKKLMKAWVDPARITVVPTGVDTGQFCPGPQPEQEKPLVVFVGAMDWEPNIDAAKYFCAEIWPLVLAKVPDAKFRIVGRNPDRRVQALAGNTVEVTGRVLSVVEHLRAAAVVVVPLRVGGGTRLKIYEAMAVGKAVVSTSVGAEGLDVHHGRDMILADSPVEFAESVITLLRDPDLRSRQGRAAAEVAANYGWPRIARKFGEVLQGLAGQRLKSDPASVEVGKDLAHSDR